VALTDSHRVALVVDDDAVYRYAFCRLVQLYGWTAHEAANGEEALKRCAELLPRIVFLDLQLPGRDGFEVCTLMRADPVCRGSLIIAISGLARHAVEERAMRTGFDTYLLKPVSENLVRAILRGAELQSGSDP
jgi:CheY-like chemotaxis protein